MSDEVSGLEEGKPEDAQVPRRYGPTKEELQRAQQVLRQLEEKGEIPRFRLRYPNVLRGEGIEQAVPSALGSSLTVVLRGFRVPVEVLDRFLEAHGAAPTHGFAPPYRGDLDPASQLLRDRVVGRGSGSSNNAGGDGAAAAAGARTRLFIPFRPAHCRPTLAYVAYDWAMVYAQRRVDLAGEPPAGFAELRDAIREFADESGRGPDGKMLRWEPEDAEGLNGLFVVVTEEQPFWFEEPYVRKSDLRCDQCEAMFVNYFEKVQHQTDSHGLKSARFDLPVDM